MCSVQITMHNTHKLFCYSINTSIFQTKVASQRTYLALRRLGSISCRWHSSVLFLHIIIVLDFMCRRLLILMSYVCRSQWSSGSTLVCGARDPKFESRCGQKFVFFTKIAAIRSFGHELHIYCSVYVDSAFHPPRDGKWVSILWLSNNTNGYRRMFGL